MITVSELIASYNGKQVLKNLSWELDEGNIHGLVGLNGSGKSTLLRCLYGLKKPDSGAIVRNGSRMLKRDMNFLETEPYFYHGITGREYLSLFVSRDEKVFEESKWAELFNVPLDELIDGYSTGMKKKLALIGLIKTGKPILLLDEPFNGLDMESSRVLSAVLKKLRDGGKTIIVTSHIIESLTGICDKIHYLRNGSIAKSYEPGDAEQMNREIFHELDRQIEINISKLIDNGPAANE